MNSIANPWRAALVALFLIACSAVPSASLFAQGRVENYTVTTFSGSIANLTALPTNIPGDDLTATLAMPFDFNYDDAVISTGSSVRIANNGWISANAGTPTGTTYSGIVGASASANTICPFHRDLYNWGGIKLGIAGSAPNRILIIEWDSIRRYQNPAPSGSTFTRMQVWLYETSNIIEFRYRDLGFDWGATGDVGLNGKTSPSFSTLKYLIGSQYSPSTQLRFTPPVKPLQQLSVQPKTVNFGNLAAGALLDMPVTVKNAGTRDNLTINSAVITGATDFTIFSSPSSNIVAPGASVTYMVRFRPQTSGTRSAVLSIASNGVDSGTQQVNLSGFGIAPAVEFGPEASLFRKTRTRLGETITQKLWLKSTGQGALTIKSINITGEFASMYTATRKGTGPLAVGDVDSIFVTYRPTEEGMRAATLTISTDALLSPDKTVSLNGLGILSRLTITPGVVRFDSVAMGDTAWTTMRLYNPGSDTLAVKADYVTYFDRDFAYFGLEGADSLIAPEKFRDVQVRFTPQSQGARQGRVRFLTNIPLTFETARRDTSTFIVDVMGTAVPFGLIGIIAPTKLDSAIIGDQICQTVKIANNGQIALTVQSATVSGPDAADFAISGVTFPATIAAGQSINVQVCGTPSSRGLRTAVVDVTSMSNERITNTQLPLAVYGLAVCGQASTNVAFENEIVLVNTSSIADISINNCGDVASSYRLDISGSGYLFVGINNTRIGQILVPVVAPGDNYTFQVAFEPMTMGTLPGTIRVQSDRIDPIEITLAGAGGNVMIARTDNFKPETALGSTSPEFTVTVKNNGNMELTPGDPSVSNNEFAYVAGSGPTSIAAGASGDYKFTFTPAASGNRTATVTFPGSSPALAAGANSFVLNGSTPTGSVRPVAANGYALGQNYPNPFAGSSAITFTMAEAGNAQIIVTDVSGKIVATVADQFFGKGENKVSFDASQMASGTYFYELVANGTRLGRSMMLNK